METVTVVAEPVPADTLAGTHTVLDREAIRTSGVHDMADLLRVVGIVHLSQGGTKRALSTASLRAGKPNFTLVLVNGVPINNIGDLLSGAFNFATLATEDIASMDILRGPLSSIYGSEAVGGVISITLRDPAEQPLFRISTEGGNYGYTATSAGMSVVQGRLALAADGGFARMGQQVLDDGFLRGTAAVQAALNVNAGKRLDTFVRWNRLNTTGFPVSSGGPEFALSRKIEADQADQMVGGTSFEHQVNSKWFYTAGYDLFSRVALNNTPAIFDSIPPGRFYVPASVSGTRFLRQRALTVQRLQLTHWLGLDGVASFRQENGTSRGTLAGVIPASYTLSRPSCFFSANATASTTRFSVTAGVGVQKSNTYHTVLSTRAGATYRFGETRLRASWGEGFKLPSFYALGSPLVSNAGLTPDFSRGFDAGVEHRFAPANLRVALTGFNNIYRDLIDFNPALFRLVNRSTAFGRAWSSKPAALHQLNLGGSVFSIDAGLQATNRPALRAGPGP